MTAYLLTWNPRRFDWEDLPSEIGAVERGENGVATWSTGSRKAMAPNSRLYMLKLGGPPSGIMGSGWSISEIYAGEHFEGREGESNYVDFQFDQLLPIDELLPIEILEREVPEVGTWHPQGSGVALPESAAGKLEQLWKTHCGGEPNELQVLGVLEGQVRLRLSRHYRRERSLRRAKLAAHAQKHAGRLPCEVPGCGFDFEETYGELGAGYAHVHHVVALGEQDGPAVTSLADLRVVCANCHAVIHRGAASLGLEDLAQAIRTGTV